MKTLDEVIDANECCNHGEPDSRCEDCQYNGIGACCAERESDALYYLKEYRDLKETMDWHEEMENIRNNLTNLLMNPPLSWDELQKMEGSPVWVEYMDDEQQTGWALIVKNPERPTFGKPTLFTFVRDEGKFYLTIAGYGKRWQAYRKERDER